MIYAFYTLCAIIIVFLSNKASVYVDLLDKKTSLSGAFIGGVMLSAVTSLPELFTSLTSTIWLDKPSLCLGNILGSNLFNLLILAVLIFIFFKDFSKTRIAKSHILVSVSIVLIYLFMMLNLQNEIPLEFLTINITSLIIIVLYVFGVKNMANDESENSDEDTSNLTVKQVVLRFILVSILIVGVSIAITYITDIIADEEHLNLGAGLAGALFLGIATSLPELSSTFALFKIKNYNIAIGNVIGSCLFNFTILSLTDIFYFKPGGIYDFNFDPKNLNLLILGPIAMIAMAIMFKFKNKYTQSICSLIVIASYILFLVI